MSIYSGFATRHQQQTYDTLTEDLIFVLQKRLLKFYRKQETDEQKFLSITSQLYNNLVKMEENKYLQPKLSKSIEEILIFLGYKEIKPHRKLDKIHKPIKESFTMPLHLKNKLKTSRQSIAKLHEFSAGKIIRQLNSNNESTNSLADSRTSFINKIQKGEKTQLQKNPEQNEFSREKKKSKFESPHIRIQNYMQRSKKSYLRGYRKRKVKSKSLSSKNVF